MAKSRNVPINIPVGTSLDVTFYFDDNPDLTSAIITMSVKRTQTDDTILFTKTPNVSKSTSLSSGQFIISFDPDDTASLTPRTYIYEIKVQIDDDIYIPLLGDFNVFGSLSQ